MFQGDIITLRPIDTADAEAMLAYLNQMPGRRGVPSEFPAHAPLSRPQVERIIETFTEDEDTTYYAIVVNSLGSATGHASLNTRWDAHSVWLDVTVGPGHDRTNIMKEVYTLLLDVAFSTTLAHNVATAHPEWDDEAGDLIVSLGFKQAGRERRSGFRDGAFYATIVFDMLRPEWQKGQP